MPVYNLAHQCEVILINVVAMVIAGRLGEILNVIYVNKQKDTMINNLYRYNHSEAILIYAQ